MLFSFDRPFLVEAYSASHSQLLLLSLAGDDGLPGPATRVDVLFKPVRALRLLTRYDRLTVRCADADETAAVLGEHPGLTLDHDDRVFLVNDGGGHVIAMAAGFHEDERPNNAPSRFTEGWAEPGGPPWARQRLSGIDRGLEYEHASTEELANALNDDPVPLAARGRVGTLFVVMLSWPDSGRDIPVGAFVTRQEAEEFVASEAVRAPAERWIEPVRVAV